MKELTAELLLSIEPVVLPTAGKKTRVVQPNELTVRKTIHLLSKAMFVDRQSLTFQRFHFRQAELQL
jgi:hypothetical protein